VGEVYGLTDSEIAFLKALADNDVPFMIVGLSAAAMQGADVVTQDIDLWFSDLTHEGIQEALRTVGAVYVAPSIEQPPMFVGGGIVGIDIVMTMSGLATFDEEMPNTVPIPIGSKTIPVLKLERILVSKQAAGRSKDRLSLKPLEDAIRVRRQRPE
jgi:hypothetical protein